MTASEDVKEGVLLRSGAVTHSTQFDQRMVILSTVSQSPTTSQNVGGQNQRGGTFTVQMPPNAVIAPPGLYMLFLLGADNTPSPALYVTLGVPVPSSGPQPPQDSGEPPTADSFASPLLLDSVSTRDQKSLSLTNASTVLGIEDALVRS